MKTAIAAALALSVATLAAAPAMAKPYPNTGLSAQDVAAVLQAKGFKAEIGTDDAGDPMIKSASEGINWRVYFYDCTAGRCTSLQFSAGFDLDNGITLAKANDWNYNKRFGRAALDDEMDPYVRYDVDVGRGYSSEALTYALDTWILVVPTFAEFVGYK